MKPPRWVRYYDRDQSGAPSADRRLPVTNDEATAITVKPSGGFWTSPVDAEYGWEHWCRDNELSWLGQPYRLRVSGTPTLVVVDSVGDLDELSARYPLRRSLGRFEYSAIDFEALARDVDGLWLTTRGHFESRMRSDLGRVNTYAWDCETVLWFRWTFDRVKEEL